MKKTIFTLSMTAMALSASAQLQLTHGNSAGIMAGSTVIKTDTVSSVKLTGGGLPNFAPANGMFWDMSNVQYNTEKSYFRFDTSTAAVFAPADYSEKVTHYLTPFMPYTTNIKFRRWPTGIRTYGEHLDRQAYCLGIATGDNLDSLVIVQQDLLYSQYINTMPYPVAPGITNWSNNVVAVTNMQLTYNAQGYSQTAMTKVTHLGRVDSAVGYGTIASLRLDNNMQSGPVNVVQVKSITTLQDSFYVGSVPMPANVLSTFGLTQGQMSYVYQYNFYRAGEFTPMLNVSYDDAAFSVLHDINLHRERLPFPVSAGNVSKDNSVALYPNPATNMVNLSIKDRSVTNCTYEITNITGQVVNTGKVTVQSGNATLSLGDVPSGMYYIRLTSNNAPVGQSPLAIIK